MSLSLSVARVYGGRIFSVEEAGGGGKIYRGLLYGLGKRIRERGCFARMSYELSLCLYIIYAVGLNNKSRLHGIEDLVRSRCTVI